MIEEQLGLEETMQQIENVMNQNPEPIKDMQLIYQFDISGAEEGTYQLHLKDTEAKVIQGIESQPACTLKMSFKTFTNF